MWSSVVKHWIDKREDPLLRALQKDLDEAPDAETAAVLAKAHDTLTRPSTYLSTYVLHICISILVFVPCLYFRMDYLSEVKWLNVRILHYEPSLYPFYKASPLINLLWILMAWAAFRYVYAIIKLFTRFWFNDLAETLYYFRMIKKQSERSRRHLPNPITPTHDHSALFRAVNKLYSKALDVKHPHLRELMHTTLVEYALIQSTKEPSLFRIEPVRSLHENIMRDDLDFDPKILEGFDFLKLRTNNWSNFPAWAFEKAKAQTPTP